MESNLISELIKLADYLDQKGHKRAADIIDDVIKKYAEDDKIHVMAWDALVEQMPELKDLIKQQTDDLLLSACGKLIPVDNIRMGHSRRHPATCETCIDLWKKLA